MLYILDAADLPTGVMYRVKATYKYVKEDVDELSFEVGDTIQVIEYDDPEDQVFFFNAALKCQTDKHICFFFVIYRKKAG